MALTDKLIAIGDGFRSSRGTSEKYTLEQMAVLAAEPVGGGSGGVSVTPKDVNFYDYEGTLLHSYTVAEVQALTELPPLPEQKGLICQGWNWDLEDIKALDCAVNVGAMYITDDGTTRLYVHFEEGRTSPICAVRLKAGSSVTVDWGDGTEPDVLSGTTSSFAIRETPRHEYAKAGDYVIRISVVGEMQFYGSSTANGGAYILCNSTSSDYLTPAYNACIQRVELGSGIADTGACAFCGCVALRSISIPKGVTIIPENFLTSSYSLKYVTVPNSVVRIRSAMLKESSVEAISLPNSVTTMDSSVFSSTKIHDITIQSAIGTYMLQSVWTLRRVNFGANATVTGIGTYALSGCKRLVSITFPASITSVGSGAMNDCYTLRYVDFTKHTAVPTMTGKAFSTSSLAPDFEIRVPAALYDEWIAATNWATYASYIVAV